MASEPSPCVSSSSWPSGPATPPSSGPWLKDIWAQLPARTTRIMLAQRPGRLYSNSGQSSHEISKRLWDVTGAGCLVADAGRSACTCSGELGAGCSCCGWTGGRAEAPHSVHMNQEASRAQNSKCRARALIHARPECCSENASMRLSSRARSFQTRCPSWSGKGWTEWRSLSSSLALLSTLMWGSTATRLRWRPQSVQDQVASLRGEDRRLSREAWRFLRSRPLPSPLITWKEHTQFFRLRPSYSAYLSFVAQHNLFLAQAGPQPDKSARRLPVRFVETLWPHLYPAVALCRRLCGWRMGVGWRANAVTCGQHMLSASKHSGDKPAKRSPRFRTQRMENLGQTIKGRERKKRRTTWSLPCTS